LNNTASQEALSQVLLNHVVNATNGTIYYEEDLTNGAVLDTLADGGSVVVGKNSSGITINEASVVLGDLLAANGVVQGINKVLIPSSVTFNLVNILEGLGNFNTLLAYLNTTDLLNIIANDPNITLFAPNDDAFNNVADLSALEGNLPVLQQVLLTHLVNSSIPFLNGSQTYNPVGGVNHTLFWNENGQVELENLDGVSEGTADITVTSFARNGTYLYGIDRVLGVPQDSGSSGGLKAWQIALIVIAGVVVGLLILGLVVGAVFFVFFKNRPGYRRIDD